MIITITLVYVLINPLVTGHLANFFLVKTGILGMINLKSLKIQ